MKSRSSLRPKAKLLLYKHLQNNRGYVVLIAVSTTVVVTSMLAAYYVLAKLESTMSLASLNNSYGFDAAEAGLNLRADDVRATFEGFNVPDGTQVLTTSGNTPCEGGNDGADDFACTTYSINDYDVTTFLLREDAANPLDDPEILQIPPGEPFEFLTAQEYQYSAYSTASRYGEDPQAILQMVFRSRLVPLFQFAAFYDKDLEILPGPDMTLSGRVHTNGNLFVNANSSLTVQAQANDTFVTMVGSLYRGRKDSNNCGGTFSAVGISGVPSSLSCNGGGRAAYTSNDHPDIVAAGGIFDVEFAELEVPDVSVFDPDPSAGDDAEYWDKADLRVVLNLNSTVNDAYKLKESDGTTIVTSGSGDVAVEIRNSDGSVDTNRTAALNSSVCTRDHDSDAGTAEVPPVYMSGVYDANSNPFFSGRENADLTMMDVNLEALLDCIYESRVSAVTAPVYPEVLLNSNRQLDDTTDGGLVFHFTIANGPTAAGLMTGKTPGTASNMAVRIYNGADVDSSNGAAPDVEGLTIVSDQAIYVAGDYNSVTQLPASFLGDTINVLSNSWDVWTDDGQNKVGSSNYVSKEPGASNTTIYAAFLAGTDITGGSEGAAGIDSGNYNGGLENYPRFHESWSGDTLTYRGSFVSLDTPRYATGSWGAQGQYYNPPARDWDFDQQFLSADTLPPLAPRFTILLQDLFVRDFGTSTN